MNTKSDISSKALEIKRRGNGVVTIYRSTKDFPLLPPLNTQSLIITHIYIGI